MKIAATGIPFTRIAIIKAATLVECDVMPGNNIYLFTDSQVSKNSIRKQWITSKFDKKCHASLNKMAESFHSNVKRKRETVTFLRWSDLRYRNDPDLLSSSTPRTCMGKVFAATKQQQRNCKEVQLLRLGTKLPNENIETDIGVALQILSLPIILVELQFT